MQTHTKYAKTHANCAPHLQKGSFGWIKLLKTQSDPTHQAEATKKSLYPAGIVIQDFSMPQKTLKFKRHDRINLNNAAEAQERDRGLFVRQIPTRSQTNRTS